MTTKRAARASKSKPLTPKQVQERVVAFIETLPEAAAKECGGQHLSLEVRGKRFGYYLDDHHGDGRLAINCKAPRGVAQQMAAQFPDRFHIPKYVGRLGWASNIAPGIHLNGALLFVAGLAVVRAHNLWVRGWPVVVTLVGWFILFLGLFRMFAPELFLKSVQRSTPAFIAPTMVALLVGIYLTFKAYYREKHQAGEDVTGLSI